MLWRKIVELGQADRAEQRGVGFERQGARLVGERAAGFVDRNAAQQAFGALDLVSPFGGDVFENAERLASYFRADAVTGKD